ncbi:MAG: helix-turn-helix transcriptional regulator [Patescibacteria group bacterium]
MAHSEAENGPRMLTVERTEQVREGIVTEEAIAEALADTRWDHRRHSVRSGTAHVLTCPVTLLESVRLNPRDYQNHRHTLGFTGSDGEPVLTYLVLGELHTNELRKLPKIEAELRGRGQVTREHFTPDELRLADRIWLPTAEIGHAIGKGRNATCSEITALLRRFHVANRGQLLVLGLKEGFLNPPLEQWCKPRKPLSPLQAQVAGHAHFAGPEIAEMLDAPIKSVHSAIDQGYEKTGARTRGELILAALAGGECRLEDLPSPEAKLTPLEHDMLPLADRSLEAASGLTGATKTTLSNRFQRICEKLGLPDREMLVVHAFGEGHIENAVDETLAEVLSRRQREVVELLMYGNDRTAGLLELSKSVVVHHLVEAKKKAGVDSRVELVAYGLRAGLIDPARPMPAGA